MIGSVFRALLRPGAVAGLICLMGGCTPEVIINTSKDQNFTRAPQRLVVINAIGSQLGEHAISYQATLAQRLKYCSVTVDFIDRPPQAPSVLPDDLATSSERAAENQRIRQFGPDTILGVNETTYRTLVQTGRVVEISFALQLIDLQSRKPVWEAQVGMDADFGDPGAALANAIVAKLVEDKILRSCAPAAS